MLAACTIFLALLALFTMQILLLLFVKTQSIELGTAFVAACIVLMAVIAFTVLYIGWFGQGYKTITLL